MWTIVAQICISGTGLRAAWTLHSAFWLCVLHDETGQLAFDVQEGLVEEWLGDTPFVLLPGPWPSRRPQEGWGCNSALDFK